MVSTHLKNISQIGSFPQIGVNIKNIWNHHLASLFIGGKTQKAVATREKHNHVYIVYIIYIYKFINNQQEQLNTGNNHYNYLRKKHVLRLECHSIWPNGTICQKKTTDFPWNSFWGRFFPKPHKTPTKMRGGPRLPKPRVWTRHQLPPRYIVQQA